MELSRKVRAVLIRRGVAPDDAEDLVQDAFVRLFGYEQTQTVRSREAVLIDAAVKLSIDLFRRRRRAPFAASDFRSDAVADQQPGPDEALQSKEALQRVAEGLKRLSPLSSRIVLARRLDGFTVAEIAEREGMTKAAVEKHIARATLALMKWTEAC